MRGTNSSDDSSRRTFRADARLGREAIAHIGARYTQFVGFMKIALPLGAAILIGLVVAWPNPYQNDAEFRISLAEISTSENDEPGLDEVRYVGLDDNNQPFVITAGRVVPDTLNPERFELKKLQADITLGDGTWVTLLADNGTYQRDLGTLSLVGHVNIFSDGGFEVRTPTAEIDLAKGYAVGHQSVRGQGPFGNLDAEGFQLINKGERIIFEGNVHFVVHPRSSS